MEMSIVRGRIEKCEIKMRGEREGKEERGRELELSPV